MEDECCTEIVVSQVGFNSLTNTLARSSIISYVYLLASGVSTIHRSQQVSQQLAKRDV